MAIGVFLMVLCLASVSCKKNAQQPDVLKPVVLPANATGIIQSNTDFAFDFLHSVLQNDKTPTNKLVSPLSIYIALSMLYNGANGATLDSIQYALRLNNAGAAYLNKTCKALLQQLPFSDNEVNLSIANSIWYDQSLQPLQSFLNINDSFYNAQVQGLNYSDPSSVNTVNNWVSSKTNGRITKIIDQLTSNLYLINAVYFKGSWKTAFDQSKTVKAQFTTAAGTNESVPFMSLTHTFNYLANDTAQMVQLPYGGGDFNMFVLLPATNYTATQLASFLNSGTFSSWQSRMDSMSVQLSIPKFQYSYGISNMQPELSDMGMGIAFTHSADLTRIYLQGAQVSQAIHKTWINVDETGTEAAAVTAIGIITTVARDNTMIVNHPFLYVIQEKSSGVILFIGIVNDPAAT
jgi:serpin B